MRKKQGSFREGIGRFLYWIPKSPQRAQISVTNLCNLDCTMCPRKDFGVPFKAMDYETYKNLVDKLDGVAELDLTGWGETFTHKDVYRMIEYATEKGIKVSVTSNALLLGPEQRKKLIASGLNRISFSLDSIAVDNAWGHLNRKGLAHIRSLIKEADGKMGVRFITTLHPKGKKDVLDVVKFASVNGVGEVALSRLDLRHNKKLKRSSESEEMAIFKAANKLGKKLGVTVNFVPGQQGKGIYRWMYNLTKHLLHRGGAYCLKTYDYLFINVEGKATPCCALPNYVVGDPKEESIKSIWNGDAFNTFRRKQRKICEVCDIAQVKNLVPSGSVKE